jgi:hypothetical protein
VRLRSHPWLPPSSWSNGLHACPAGPQEQLDAARFTRKRSARLANVPVHVRRLTVRGAYRLAHKRSLGLGGADLSELLACRSSPAKWTAGSPEVANGQGLSKTARATSCTCAVPHDGPVAPLWPWPAMASCSLCFAGVPATIQAEHVSAGHGRGATLWGSGGGSDVERLPCARWGRGGSLADPGAQSVADVAEAGVGRKGVVRAELLLGDSIAAAHQAWHSAQYGRLLLATGPSFEVHSLRSDVIFVAEVDIFGLVRGGRVEGPRGERGEGSSRPPRSFNQRLGSSMLTRCRCR